MAASLRQRLTFRNCYQHHDVRTAGTFPRLAFGEGLMALAALICFRAHRTSAPKGDSLPGIY